MKCGFLWNITWKNINLWWCQQVIMGSNSCGEFWWSLCLISVLCVLSRGTYVRILWCWCGASHRETLHQKRTIISAEQKYFLCLTPKYTQTTSCMYTVLLSLGTMPRYTTSSSHATYLHLHLLIYWKWNYFLIGQNFFFYLVQFIAWEEMQIL